MHDAVVEHMDRLGQSYLELAEMLPEEAFSQQLPAKSNEIEEQFWCVIGARESYATAIRRGTWAGFSFSLPGAATGDTTEVIEALKRSTRALTEAVADFEWTDSRQDCSLPSSSTRPSTRVS